MRKSFSSSQTVWRFHLISFQISFWRDVTLEHMSLTCFSRSPLQKQFSKFARSWRGSCAKRNSGACRHCVVFNSVKCASRLDTAPRHDRSITLWRQRECDAPHSRDSCRLLATPPFPSIQQIDRPVLFCCSFYPEPYSLCFVSEIGKDGTVSNLRHYATLKQPQHNPAKLNHVFCVFSSLGCFRFITVY